MSVLGQDRASVPPSMDDFVVAALSTYSSTLRFTEGQIISRAFAEGQEVVMDL